MNLASIECNLALSTPEDVDGYNRVATRRGMLPVDPEILRVMNAARMRQTVASFALVPQMPMLAEGLEPALEAWRQTVGALRALAYGALGAARELTGRSLARLWQQPAAVVAVAVQLP